MGAPDSGYVILSLLSICGCKNIPTAKPNLTPESLGFPRIFNYNVSLVFRGYFTQRFSKDYLNGLL